MWKCIQLENEQQISNFQISNFQINKMKPSEALINLYYQKKPTVLTESLTVIRSSLNMVFNKLEIKKAVEEFTASRFRM